MIVETAQLSDLPEVMKLEEYFDVAWSPESWREEIEGEGRLVLIARDTQVVGVACFQLVEDVADLHRIAVAPGHRRLGLARVMLVAGLQWAIGQGATRMLLEVESGNEAAIALYRGYGFRQVASRPGYYGAARDALVLERHLEGVDADSVGMWDMEESHE